MNVMTESVTIAELIAMAEGHIFLLEDDPHGLNWCIEQKQMLIDSILRGYPIQPLYVRAVTVSSRLAQNTHYRVVDGRKRLLALHEYLRGEFKLAARGSSDARDGVDFSGLGDELRNKLLGARVELVIVDTDDESELIELYERLNAAMGNAKQEEENPARASQMGIGTRPGQAVQISYCGGIYKFRALNAARNYVYFREHGEMPKFNMNAKGCIRFLGKQGCEVTLLDDSDFEEENGAVLIPKAPANGTSGTRGTRQAVRIIDKGGVARDCSSINEARAWVYFKIEGKNPQYQANAQTCRRYLEKNGYQVIDL